MRGVFTASVVAAIEEITKRPITDDIDLVVGTSTGALIALGLASGRSGEELVSLYRDRGPEIFGHPRRITQWIRPKYSRSALDAVLQEYFGGLRMEDLALPTCITAYEALNGKPRVYKTKHHDGLYWGHEQLVWKVAAATSAAPTYFAPVEIEAGDRHVDGGVWANNPAVVGITEAVHRFGRRLEDIRVLSIGTAAPSARLHSGRNVERMGRARWLKPAFELLQSGPSAGTHYQALQLLGGDRYIRVDDKTQAPLKLDDVGGCMALGVVGREQARARYDEINGVLGISGTPSLGSPNGT
jgi:patatin-like phospholipase/acyl hydrolase